MKIGFVLPTWSAGLDGRDPTWSDLRALAVEAENAGFESLWAVDNILFRSNGTNIGIWECWSILTALAASTDRVEIGSLISNHNFRNPAFVGKLATTVEEISGGRLILGLGAGDSEPQHEAFGFRYDYRVTRFADALKIIDPLIRKGYVDYKGEYYKAVDCDLVLRGPRPEGPPIMIGGMGPKMMRLAVQHGDMWNAWVAWDDSSLEFSRPLLERLDEICADEGRDPATLGRSICVGVSLDGASLPFGPDDFKSAALTGDPDEIASTLVEYARLGVDHLQIQLGPSTQEGISACSEILAAVRKEL